MEQALDYGQALERMLQGEHHAKLLNQMYGNSPSQWSDELSESERFRVLCNYFTRMRFCDASGGLILDAKGAADTPPPTSYPWYAVPNRKSIQETLIFGHWAALRGRCPIENIYALDTGCVWGGELTALRLADKHRFSVPGL